VKGNQAGGATDKIKARVTTGIDAASPRGIPNESLACICLRRAYSGSGRGPMVALEEIRASWVVAGAVLWAFAVATIARAGCRCWAIQTKMRFSCPERDLLML
jgi:hypothetical protein